MHRRACRDGRPVSMLNRWLRGILAISLVASLVAVPGATSAQSTESTELKTYRDVAISVEGHEPQVVWSGEVSSYSEDHINGLVDDFMESSGNGTSRSAANGASAASQSTSPVRSELVTCDRTTDLLIRTDPAREVVGETFAMCIGQFKWVVLTGSLRLKRRWRPDKVLDERENTAYYSGETMEAEPYVLCDGTSTSAFRARNDVKITFNDGRTLQLWPHRETPWHWYRCRV